MALDYWNAYQSDPELRELAEDWATHPTPDWTAADDRLLDWMHSNPDRALATICAIAQISDDPQRLGLLAAGPLENLLCIQGERVLEPIRILAHQHNSFRDLVAGVWQHTMTNVLYQKVRAIGLGRL